VDNELIEKPGLGPTALTNEQWLRRDADGHAASPRGLA